MTHEPSGPRVAQARLEADICSSPLSKHRAAGVSPRCVNISIPGLRCHSVTVTCCHACACMLVSFGSSALTSRTASPPSARADVPVVFCFTDTTRSWVRPEAKAGAAQSAQALPVQDNLTSARALLSIGLSPPPGAITYLLSLWRHTFLPDSSARRLPRGFVGLHLSFGYNSTTARFRGVIICCLLIFPNLGH